MLNIEKNIAMPTTKTNAKWGFAEMGLGDSAAVSSEDVGRIRAASSLFGKRNNKKFSIRKINNSAYRIWRVE